MDMEGSPIWWKPDPTDIVSVPIPNRDEDSELGRFAYE
jgi:hypothetical protein